VYTARVLKKVAFVRRLYAHDPHILKIYRSVNRLNSLSNTWLFETQSQPLLKNRSIRGMAWPEMLWLLMAASWGLLCKRWWTFGFYKMRGISWVSNYLCAK